MSETTHAACAAGEETAQARWLDTKHPQRMRLLWLLSHFMGDDPICLQRIRSILAMENVRGRMSDLVDLGYQIKGAGELPLCECHNGQLYQLKSLEPGEARVKQHGGTWYRDNREGLVVRLHKPQLESTYSEAEQGRIRQAILDAIEATEARIAQEKLPPVGQVALPLGDR